MRATTSITPQGEKKSFSAIINSTSTREMINKSVGDPARAAALVSTVISVVNSTPKLKECDASGIISAALRGEIGMGLSVALGDYAIIPYGSNASFQLQVNGLKRLAIRSGAYSAVNFREVKEGEYLGRDPRTCEPKFKWIEDDDARESLKTIGYYGFYMLSPEYNNFFQCIYWTKAQCVKHADRFSKAFSKEKFDAMEAGMLSADEVMKLRSGSPWYDTEGNGFTKMCLKTIAKQLLGDGLAPKQVMEAIAVDNAEEKSGEPAMFDNAINNTFASEATDVVDVDETTGEVIEQNAQNDAQATVADNARKDTATAPKTAQRSNKAAQTQNEDAPNSFFDN